MDSIAIIGLARNLLTWFIRLKYTRIARVDVSIIAEVSADAAQVLLGAEVGPRGNPVLRNYIAQIDAVFLLALRHPSRGE